MDFSFETERIREVCEVRKAAVAALGEADALELARRLADIDAAANAAIFAAVSGDLEGTNGDRLTFTLPSGRLVTLVPGNSKPRVTKVGTADWARITRFRVEAIEGVHG